MLDIEDSRRAHKLQVYMLKYIYIYMYIYMFELWPFRLLCLGYRGGSCATQGAPHRHAAHI